MCSPLSFRSLAGACQVVGVDPHGRALRGTCDRPLRDVASLAGRWERLSDLMDQEEHRQNRGHARESTPLREDANQRAASWGRSGSGFSRDGGHIPIFYRSPPRGTKCRARLRVTHPGQALPRHKPPPDRHSRTPCFTAPARPRLRGFTITRGTAQYAHDRGTGSVEIPTTTGLTGLPGPGIYSSSSKAPSDHGLGQTTLTFITGRVPLPFS